MSDKVQKAEHRASLYKLLALIYLEEPNAQLLDLLKNVGLGTSSSLEDLAVEYARLFIGPGKHFAPYESVQRADDSGKYWGNATVVVKKIIESTGLKYESSFTGMPDHLGVELEFMQKLIEHQLKAERQGDQPGAERAQKAQKRFFNDHLWQWGPQFCRQVKKAARLKFYKDALALTEEFLEQEKEDLKLS